MKSGAIFHHVMLWTVALIAAPAEGTGTYSAAKTGQSPIQNNIATRIWFSETGLIAFATTLDWNGVKALYAGFSKATCQNLGKVKNVIPKKESMVQIPFHKYLPLEDIRFFLATLAEEKRSKKVVKFVPSIGKSFEGRSIFAVHITHNVKNAPKMRPKIYIQCLIHARDWISGSVCVYLAHYLVKNQDAERTNALLKKVEFVIVPVVNPDGYVKSWSGKEHRLWCKNLSKYPGQRNEHQGVDLNRNFPYAWALKPDEIHGDEYPGPYQMSEPEVKVIMGYIRCIAPVYGAIDLHSYGQNVIYPYLSNKYLPADHKEKEQLSKVAQKTAKAMTKVMKKKYTKKNGKTYGKTVAGTFLDWAYSEEVAEFNTDNGGKHYRITPLTIELRPDTKKKGGFKLSPIEIHDTCREALKGILTFADHVYKNPIVMKERK